MSDHLIINDKLRPGEKIVSENNKYSFVMQEDGNLVLYRHGNSRALWASGTNGKSVDWLVLQEDGNLVIYGEGKALWSSGTHGQSVAKLIMQHDGNAVIYRPDGKPIWATNTVSPSEPSLIDQVKGQLAEFCKENLAIGNKRKASVEELTLNGTIVHYRVSIRSRQDPIRGTTLYSFTYEIRGDIDLLNPAGSVGGNEICINAPAPVNKLCCTVEEIVTILLPLL